MWHSSNAGNRVWPSHDWSLYLSLCVTFNRFSDNVKKQLLLNVLLLMREPLHRLDQWNIIYWGSFRWQLNTVGTPGTQWADLDTTFLLFALLTEFTPTWNQSTSGKPLQSSQWYGWFSIGYCNPRFWVCFCLSYFFSYLVKNGMDRVSVVCKLAMKWYLMRMCASWLSPLNYNV